MKFSIRMTMVCACCLVAVGCQTTTASKPCDILTVIPTAPPHVNRLIVKDAKATARGLAINKRKVQRYKCRS